MRCFRTRAAAIVLGALALLLLPIGAASPPASAAPLPLLNHFDWNICGGGGAGCAGGSLSAAYSAYDWAITQTPSNHPLAISTQETCQSQYNWLAWALSNAGYQAAMQQAITSSPSCGGVAYGNAIFWAGGCAGGSASTCVAASAFAHQVPGEQNRGYVCGRAVSLVTYTACSAHMTNLTTTQGGKRIQTWQGEDYYAAITFFNGLGTTTYGAGDFQLQPFQAEFPSAFHSTYDETDQGYWKNTVSGRKIDYIWIPPSHMQITAQATVTVTGSDHYPYYGYMGLPRVWLTAVVT